MHLIISNNFDELSILVLQIKCYKTMNSLGGCCRLLFSNEQFFTSHDITGIYETLTALAALAGVTRYRRRQRLLLHFFIYATCDRHIINDQEVRALRLESPRRYCFALSGDGTSVLGLRISALHCFHFALSAPSSSALSFCDPSAFFTSALLFLPFSALPNFWLTCWYTSSLTD